MTDEEHVAFSPHAHGKNDHRVIISNAPSHTHVTKGVIVVGDYPVISTSPVGDSRSTIVRDWVPRRNHCAFRQSYSGHIHQVAAATGW